MAILIILFIGILLLISVYFLLEWIKALLKTIELILRVSIIILLTCASLDYLKKMDTIYFNCNAPKENINLLDEKQRDVPLKKKGKDANELNRIYYSMLIKDDYKSSLN